jgi:bacteriophage exclusion system BrxB-like protein
VSSLRTDVRLLERDLTAVPMSISAYHDLPFAILRYNPEEEWELRREVRHLVTRLHNAGKQVHAISLAELLWEVVEGAEGIETVAELERLRGFETAQQQVTTYLIDPEWSPLPLVLKDRLDPLDPEHDIAFLVRAAAMAPSLYHMSRLLDEMQGKTKVPTILFYPGGLEGATGLRFMGLRNRETTGNYRVK